MTKSTSKQPININKDAAEFVKKINLDKIVMTQGSFTRNSNLDRFQYSEIEVNGGLKINFNISENGLSAVAIMNVSAIGNIKNESNNIIEAFTINATYQAVYSVKEAVLTIENRINLFNLILSRSTHQHLWPYWREFAQQVTNRIGAPPLVAPLLISMPLEHSSTEKPKTENITKRKAPSTKK